VPGTAARKGLMPDGSPVPGLKPEMLKYANAMWPAPSTPDRPDGTAIAYANPKNSVGENFGLARYDYVISSKDSFSANLTYDDGTRRVPWGGGGGDPNYVAMSGIRAQTLGMQETHVFSAGMVNVATLGYRYPQTSCFSQGAIPAALLSGVGSARLPRQRLRACPEATPI